jgi:hypothetical protein
MKFLQVIKRIFKMDIVSKVNSFLEDYVDVPNIDEIDHKIFERHVILHILDLTGLEICLEENNQLIPVKLLELSPTYATFRRPDGSWLGRNLEWVDDIWI